MSSMRSCLSLNSMLSIMLLCILSRQGIKSLGSLQSSMPGLLGGGNPQTIYAVSIVSGFMLIIAAAISGTTMLIAFFKGLMVVHTLSEINVNVVRVLFDFFTPLAGGIILIIAGGTIRRLDSSAMQRHTLRAGRARLAQERTRVIGSLLSNDEKYVLGLVGGRDGMLQSDLVLKSNFSKVKMHRILKKLESKELIRRMRFGITNKVSIANR